MAISKKEKATAARKNAEAQKAKKKAVRGTKVDSSAATAVRGKKPASIIKKKTTKK